MPFRNGRQVVRAIKKAAILWANVAQGMAAWRSWPFVLGIVGLHLWPFAPSPLALWFIGYGVQAFRGTPCGGVFQPFCAALFAILTGVAVVWEACLCRLAALLAGKTGDEVVFRDDGNTELLGF